MKKYIFLLLAAALIIYPQLALSEITIKLGLVTKPGSAQNIVAEKFRDLLTQKSGGSIRVKIFHSGSIGNETEILQQIQMNTIQMGIITGGPFDTFDPIVRVINYPFMFRNNAQADKILDGPLGREILESLETSGFKGLCFSENGFRNLTNSKRHVKTPEDLKGLKIRVMSSTLHKSIWQNLGANPTPMPWPIYSELEQGVIDGQENPLWVMEVYKLYEIQKYLTLTRHVYSPHIDVASLVWWNGLAKTDQNIIQEAISKAAIHQRELNRAKNNQRLELLRNQGMTVEDNPDIKAFRQTVADLKDMDLFAEPRVKSLLDRMLEATK